MRETQSPCFFGVPEKDGIYQISFEITNRCNLHCIHCMNKSENDVNTDDGLPWDSMYLLINEMKKNHVKEIYISGGEPTMYPYFENLVKETKRLGMDTLVATNAYQIEPFINVLKNYVDVVFVSIDGTPARHDFFRGQVGAYERSLRNIKRLIELNIPIRISTVVSKNNYLDLEHIIQDVRSLGVFQIHFTVLVKVGRASAGEMLITADDYRQLSKTIALLQKKYELEGFLITTRRNGSLGIETEPCYAGIKMAHLTSSGIVAPCSYLAKCKIGKPYCIQWTPGNFSKCLVHVRRFHSICEERKAYFNHSSCAALASIATDSADIYAVDPLDTIFGY